MLYGTSKLIVDNLHEKQPYGAIKKVISINLIYFELGQRKDYVYHGSTKFLGIHHHDTLELGPGQLETFKAETIAQLYPEYYIIRINEFNDIAKDGLDEWIYFLKNESVPAGTKAKELKQAEKALDILKLKPK